MIRFCTHCGTRLGGLPPVRCSACASWTYRNAVPTGSAVILRDGEFLAVRRAYDPAAGAWDIPGGFCDGPEHPEDAARREVKEETGLDVRIGPLIGLYMGDYAYQGDILATLNAYYLARPEHLGQDAYAGHESEEIEWFDLSRPPTLAFRHQKKMIIDAVAAARRWRDSD